MVRLLSPHPFLKKIKIQLNTPSSHRYKHDGLVGGGRHHGTSLGAGSGSGFQLGAVVALRCWWLQRDPCLGGAPPGPGLLSEGQRLRDGCGWDAGSGAQAPAWGPGAARADGRLPARRSGGSCWTAPGGGSNRARPPPEGPGGAYGAPE